MTNFPAQTASSPRALLVRFYHQALQAVDGFSRTCAALQARPMSGPVTVIALGKAAQRMLEGAQIVLGEQLQRALLVTKTGYATAPLAATIELIEAGHPVPDAASLAAGARLIAVLEQLPPEHSLLMLISGGTSSLVEVLPADMSLDELQRVNAWLLASGLPIEVVNALRSRLSQLKGGRLRSSVPLERTRVLLMSDVPNDDPALIGSGLLYPSAQQSALPALPDGLQMIVDRYGSTPPAVDGSTLDTQLIASLELALSAIEMAARHDGLPVYRHRERLAGAAEQTGYALADMLRTSAAGLHVWGGETTVRLPEQPGVGGRCQQLALAAALRLEGCSDVHLLAGCTDGSDGPTSTAGACIDGATCARGRAEGIDPQTALTGADAGRFLEASGDLLETGPTGSNVNDIVIAWKGTQP